MFLGGPILEKIVVTIFTTCFYVRKINFFPAFYVSYFLKGCVIIEKTVVTIFTTYYNFRITIVHFPQSMFRIFLRGGLKATLPYCSFWRNIGFSVRYELTLKYHLDKYTLKD
jgi:hypothetical protein